MLKTIRKIPFVNWLVRNFLKRSEGLLVNVSKHWRIAGTVDIHIAGHDIKFYTKGDDALVDNFFYKRSYVEENDLWLFSNLAGTSKVILDIGANTGLYSLVSAAANPHAKIVAFEPNPINFFRLRQNVKLNQFENVTTLQQAVGNDEREISFFVPANDIISDTSSADRKFSENTYKGQLDWKEIHVRQTSLSSFLNSQAIAKVDLIKIDVEGYEMSVFSGAGDLFERSHPIVLCEVFLDDERMNYFELFLLKYNYNAYLILQNGLVFLGTRLVKNKDGLNYLFAPGKTRAIYTSFKEVENLLIDLSGSSHE